MTKTPLSLLTQGAASRHNASESAPINRDSKQQAVYTATDSMSHGRVGRCLEVGRALPRCSYRHLASLSESGYNRIHCIYSEF